MASTDLGRGKDLPLGFTNTIADKSAEQAMLRKLDELLERVNLLTRVLAANDNSSIADARVDIVAGIEAYAAAPADLDEAAVANIEEIELKN